MSVQFLHGSLFFICAAILQQPAVSAEISINSNGTAIQIVGEIVEGDTGRFVFELDKGFGNIRVVELRSPGGNVDEAIRIGELVRKCRFLTRSPFSDTNGNFICRSENEITPTGSENCTCASACSLIWFGGVWRIGSVGLHRSYSDNSLGGFNQYEQILKDSQNEISTYLEGMRIPSWVKDAMFQVSSNNLSVVSMLDHSDLIIDSVFEEFIISMCGDFAMKRSAANTSQIEKQCYFDAHKIAIDEQATEENLWLDVATVYSEIHPELVDPANIVVFDEQVGIMTSDPRNEGKTLFEKLEMARRSFYLKTTGSEPPN